MCDYSTQLCVDDGSGDDNGGGNLIKGGGSSRDRCDEDADGYKKITTACGGTDCNDNYNFVHPGADERCNSFDDDCDGKIDEGCDDDDDDYCDENMIYTHLTGSDTCTAGGDCDDEDSSVNPGEEEVCDGGKIITILGIHVTNTRNKVWPLFLNIRKGFGEILVVAIRQWVVD